MSEFRDGLKTASKDSGYTAWTIFKWGLLLVIVVSALGFIAQSLGIFGRDIDREVTQHSRQYVETKTVVLQKLHNDWLQLNTELAELGSNPDASEEIVAAKQAQQKNIVKRMRTEASFIPGNEVPEDIKSFLSER